MLIGFDASRAFVPDRTGTENYSYQLLKALVKIDRINKYVVYVRPNSVIPPKGGIQLNSSHSDLDSRTPRVLASSKWRLRGNDNKSIEYKVINWPRLWTQGGLAIQTFKDKLDVLFVPAHTLPLIRKQGLKTVVTVHDLGSEYLPQAHQIKQRLYLGFMQKYQLKGATKIIAVSEATKKDLVERVGLESGKVTVIYEGYDKELFKPVKNDLLVNSLKQYGLEPGDYFLFVGTIQPRKNLERLIQAFATFMSLRTRLGGCGNLPSQETDGGRRFLADARNDNLKLAIAGSKGWMSKSIYELPKKLGIEEKVKFLGYVTDKDLPSLYSGAIALLFPSLFEGFGLPVIEAQACGCPVLTSNISSMPEIAGPTSPRLRGVNEGAVLVNPYEIDDIVKGMKEINNQDTRIKLKKAGFENVKRFSWEKCAAQTLEVLEGL